MKKDSIIKMLKTLNAEASELNIAIIYVIISEGGVLSGIKKVSLIGKIMKDTKLATTEGAIRLALRKLNTKEVVTWTIIKGAAWVNLTNRAQIEYVNGVAKKGVADLVNKFETAINELSVLMKRKGGNLKKKVLKNSSKKLNRLTKYLREK